jgi:hypothetical protein
MQRSQIPTNKEFTDIGGMDELKMNLEHQNSVRSHTKLDKLRQAVNSNLKLL